jgi:hypothetical protein
VVERAEGEGSATAVAALSRALGRLAGEIAAALHEVRPPQGSGPR